MSNNLAHVQETYLLAFRRSMTFRTIDGKTTFISSAEIVRGVQLIQTIPATREAPALYELAFCLDGERKVLIVRKSQVELRKERSRSSYLICDSGVRATRAAPDPEQLRCVQ